MFEIRSNADVLYLCAFNCAGNASWKLHHVRLPCAYIQTLLELQEPVDLYIGLSIYRWVSLNTFE